MILSVFHDAAALIYREARLLDTRDFTSWLECFEKDVVFWMPAWRSDGRMTDDPERELSLVYYRGRSNLEDRIRRLRSNQSPVHNVPARVTHIITNLELVQTEDNLIDVHSCFETHVYDPRTDITRTFVGRYDHGLRDTGHGWRILKKVVRLQNDVIPTVLDVNMV